MAEIDKKLNSREIIDQKRKEFEEKYNTKLQQRIERSVPTYSMRGVGSDTR